MPYVINPNTVCAKCQRAKLVETDHLTQKTKILLDIGSVIIILPNQEKTWINLCSQHISILRVWMRNGIAQLPRGIEGNQLRLEETIKMGLGIAPDGDRKTHNISE